MLCISTIQSFSHRFHLISNYKHLFQQIADQEISLFYFSKYDKFVLFSAHSVLVFKDISYIWACPICFAKQNLL